MLTYTTLQNRPRRVSRCDRTDARRICASARGVCDRLCGAVSVRPDLGGHAAPTSCRWWGHRNLATDGRQTAFHPRLPENQSFTNHAWLTIPAEPTPDPLLDSSLVARLAACFNGARHGAGTRRQPGGHHAWPWRAPPRWPLTGRNVAASVPKMPRRKRSITAGRRKRIRIKIGCSSTRDRQSRSTWGRLCPAKNTTKKPPMTARCYPSHATLDKDTGFQGYEPAGILPAQPKKSRKARP